MQKVAKASPQSIGDRSEAEPGAAWPDAGGARPNIILLGKLINDPLLFECRIAKIDK